MRKDSLAGKTFGLMVITALEKVLAFVRTAVCAALFGATVQTDAFYMAANIVGIVAGVSNSFSTVVVPVRTQVLAEEGNEAADQYISSLLNLTLIISLAAAIFTFPFAPWLVRLFAPDFAGEVFNTTLLILRIFLPIIVFTTAMSILTGLLNTHRRFTAASLIGFPLNIAWLVLPLLLVRQWGIYAMVAGFLVGSLLQVLILLPFIRGIYRYGFHFNWKSSHIKKSFAMAIPIFIGTAANSINQAVDKALASGLAEGSISALGYSSQLISLVQSIFIFSITTTTFTSLSFLAQEQNIAEVKRFVNHTLSVLSLVLLPITFLCIVFSQEIVTVVFQRGAFDQRANVLTSGAFLYYMLGILPYAVCFTVTRCFYALKETKTPLYINMGLTGINVVLNLILVKSMQANGLALATSLAFIAGSLAMLIALRRRLGSMGYVQWLRELGIMIVPLLLLAAMTFAVRLLHLPAFLSLALAAAAGIGVYFGALLVLRQQDALFVKNHLMSLLRRNQGAD